MSTTETISQIDRAVEQDSKPLIIANGLNKSYGKGPAILKDISLSIATNDFISLIGPSGCGKSTLLKLVAGLSQITSGTLTIDGKPPAKARDLMSFIFQDATLLPWRTVLQNIKLLLELQGGFSPEQMQTTAMKLLELVHLKHVVNHYPRELSGGMKMRVSIARALATQPKLLLMDEPFGALDEMTRDYLNEELLRIRSEQKWTAMFVTHSVAEAVFLSTRVIVMSRDHGRILNDIPIPFPYPRVSSLRSDPLFLELVGRVSQALRESHPEEHP